MINRVLIRLKIVQIVYAYYQNGGKNLDTAEKELFFSLSKAYDLYNYLLLLMVEVTKQANKRLNAAKNKLVPTKEELFPNTKFVENRFIAQLEVNKQLLEFSNNQKKTWENEADFVKTLCDKILESDIYKEYMASETSSYEEDRELWRKLYKNIIFNNIELDQVLEDQSLYWNDDKEIVEAIEIYLQQEGYHILKAYDGEEALEILKENEVHLLIMDVMMPRLDGIRATLKIREESSIPIIILSAKTEDADKILGLNIGADDYVEKPFNPLELVARVKSQLRRYTQLGNAAENSASVYTVGGLSINDDLKEVTVDGEVVKLTPIEYNILLLLVKNQGKVFSINQIYESIWNEDAIGADNTVAVHIRHIREKIEINPKEPRYLKVVWGVGYKIDKN